MSRLPHIPPQETYFYKGPWTKLEDDVFIEELVEQKKQGFWRNDDHVNFTALINAIHNLNFRLNTTLTWQDGFERKADYHERYTTFKSILDDGKTWWDRVGDNKIYTSKQAWLRMMRENEFVKAYFRAGEPEWNRLDRLFYNPSVEDETIVIPSDAEDDDNVNEDASGGYKTEDVSPMTKTARGFAPLKLFDEDEDDDATDIPCIEPFYSSGKYINLGSPIRGSKGKGKGVGSSSSGGNAKGKGKKKW